MNSGWFIDVGKSKELKTGLGTKENELALDMLGLRIPMGYLGRNMQ